LGVGGRKSNKRKEKESKRESFDARAYSQKENPTHFKEVDGE
jgi:hypothetical protein